MSAPNSLVAAAAIVDNLHAPTRLLAARRSAPKSLAGQWEFPGGKVEPGEAPIAALHREIAEELGVSIEVGTEVAPSGNGPWPIMHGHVMRVWLAQISDGEPAPLQDHDALTWLALADLDSLPWLAPDIPIVAAVRERCLAINQLDN